MTQDQAQRSRPIDPFEPMIGFAVEGEPVPVRKHLPGLIMIFGGIGQHTVEIEDDALQRRSGQKKGIGAHPQRTAVVDNVRSVEHTSELQSLMRISYAVFCLKKKNKTKQISER